MGCALSGQTVALLHTLSPRLLPGTVQASREHGALPALPPATSKGPFFFRSSRTASANSLPPFFSSVFPRQGQGSVRVPPCLRHTDTQHVTGLQTLSGLSSYILTRLQNRIYALAGRGGKPRRIYPRPVATRHDCSFWLLLLPPTLGVQNSGEDARDMKGAWETRWHWLPMSPLRFSYLGQKLQIRRSVREHLLLLPTSQRSWKEAQDKVLPVGHLWASTACLVPILQLWCHMRIK